MKLDVWLSRQEKVSAEHIAAAISASGITHRRPAFGLEVVPAAGSVLASTARALWDPEPDYFYHWVRDAAVVMLAAMVLRPQDPAGWDARFADYVRFSHRIATRPGPPANPLRAGTSPQHLKFLRPDAELAALDGPALLGEPRVNADGTADMERWSRPQFDGPALRALSLMAFEGEPPPEAGPLLALDLGHVLTHAAAPAIGPWEEEPPARTAFTLLAQRAALRRGAALIEDEETLAEALMEIEAALAGLWDPAEATLRACDISQASDAAALLGILLDPFAETFGVGDPRVAATLAHIETWSREVYPIVAAGAPLVGRWRDDIYFGGNPWLPTSFGVAELCYRQALWLSDGVAAGEAFARGEAVLGALAMLLPEPGPLPEQLDRATGAPTSCRDLTWSHAALISAADARRAVLMRRQSRAAGF